MNYWVVILGAVALLLLYFDLVASIIIASDHSLSLSHKVLQIAFVWLIPIIGFSFALRFSYQSAPSPFHKKLIPKTIGNWIYDESFRNSNSNRDDNDLKTVTGFPTFWPWK